MKQTKNRIGMVFLAITLILTAVSTWFCGYMYKTNTDYFEVTYTHQTPLFKNNSLTTIYYILIVAGMVILSLGGVFSRKNQPIPKQPEKASWHTVLTVFARCFAGVALLSTVYMQFFGKINVSGTPYDISQTGSAVLYQKCALFLSVIAAAYFLIPAIVTRKIPSLVMVITGVGLVLWLSTQLLVTHYFMKDFITSPVRVFKLISLSFAVFFVLTDMRFLFHERRKTGWFVAMGLITFFICITESLPLMVLSVAHSPQFKMGIDTFYQFTRIAIGVYALISVLPTLLTAEKIPAPIKQTAFTGDEQKESAQNIGQKAEEPLPSERDTDQPEYPDTSEGVTGSDMPEKESEQTENSLPADTDFSTNEPPSKEEPMSDENPAEEQEQNTNEAESTFAASKETEDREE